MTITTSAAGATTHGASPIELDTASMAIPFPPPLTREPTRLRLRLIIVEGVALAAAWSLALVIGVYDGRFWGGVPAALVETIVLVMAGLLLSMAMRLYQSRVSAVRSVTLERQALIAMMLTALSFAMQRVGIERPPISPALSGGILCFVFLVSARGLFESWLTLLRRNGALSRPVVLVGTAHEASNLAHLLDSHPDIGYRPVGYLSDDLDPKPDLDGVPYMGRVAATARAVNYAEATGVIIAANGISSTELNAVVRDLHDLGVHVHLSTGLTRIGHRRLRQLPMAHEPFFYLEPTGPTRIELIAKRAIDLVGASLVLVLASPVLLVSALLIKLSDGGPVLFRQVRIGRDGRPFVIRKLRTMTVGAEDSLEELRDRNERNGPLFKLEDDPRVTRVGHWLRVTSIDELPQLLDVLQGTLSLVGPRPALPDEVAQFDEEMLGRQRMLPGVTGLWQVEARHNPSFFAYRHLDLFYVENWRLSLDLAILASTLWTVVGDALHSAHRSSSDPQPITTGVVG